MSAVPMITLTVLSNIDNPKEHLNFVEVVKDHKIVSYQFSYPSYTNYTFPYGNQMYFLCQKRGLEFGIFDGGFWYERYKMCPSGDFIFETGGIDSDGSDTSKTFKRLITVHDNESPRNAVIKAYNILHPELFL